MINFSVILPNYNHEDYLAIRIESILNQTYEDFELIILDDCSTDNSRDIIEKYRNHPKISKIVFNETNSGSTFLQWEKGVKLAKGKYIWLAESDDYADVNFLFKTENILVNNQDVGLAFCASKIIDQNGNILNEKYQYNSILKSLMSSSFVMNGKEFCEQYLYFACVLVNASAVVFEKKLYENVAQDYKNYKVSGDWRMWVEICYQTNVAYLDECLNYFRFHTNNVRTNKADLMNREAVFNYMASLKKTNSEFVRKKLKDRLFLHWCFEFSRDMKRLRFGQSLDMMMRISKIDSSFFQKLFHHSMGKINIGLNIIVKKLNKVHN